MENLPSDPMAQLRLKNRSSSEASAASEAQNLVCNVLGETRFKKMRKGILNACRIFSDWADAQDLQVNAYFVTLTYRPSVKWEPGQLTKYRDNLAHHVKRNGGGILRGVWKLELTKKGVVHYHCVWWVPAKVWLDFPDKTGWSFGRTEQQIARSPIGYLAKYVGKDAGDYGGVPPRARTWGVVGFTSEEKTAWRYSMLPAWLQEFCEPTDDVRRVTLGSGDDAETWWENRTKRVRMRSPYIYDPFYGHGDRAQVHWRGWTYDDVQLY